MATVWSALLGLWGLSIMLAPTAIAKPLLLTRQHERSTVANLDEVLQERSTPLEGSTNASHDGTLQKRKMPTDICGKFNSGVPGTDFRTVSVWTDNKLDDWLETTTEPYSQDDCKWKYNSCKGPGMPESWQRFLMGIGGPDSVDDCRIIGNDCVYFIDSTLCNLYPEAHFALWATSRFATYLNSLYINLGAVRDFLDGDYGDIQTSFYTPKTPPSKLTLPLNILAGIMSAITAIAPLFGPAALAAIPAGVATILNGILVLDELRTPDPLEIWSDVQPTVSKIWKGMITALENLYKSHMTDPLPSAADWDKPDSMKAMLKGGQFADWTDLPVFDTPLYPTLASTLINALWVEDGVFIVKLTDAAANNPKGGACKLYDKYNWCDEKGVAWYFIRWTKPTGHIDLSGSTHPIDPTAWAVWGAYEDGTEKEGTPNKNSLPTYGLDLKTIALSSEKTQNDHGGQILFQDDYKEQIEAFKKNPKDLTTDKLIKWNLPFCDVGKILADKGYDHIAYGSVLDDKIQKEDVWKVGIACTCRTLKGWTNNEKYQVTAQSKAQDPSRPDDDGTCNRWRKKGEKDAPDAKPCVGVQCGGHKRRDLPEDFEFVTREEATGGRLK